MRLFYTLLVFGFALQIVAFLFWAFELFPLINYPLGDVSSVTATFSITPFDLAFTGVGIVGIGLAWMLLKQNANAIYALLIWGIGTIIPVVRNFFLVIPNTLAALIPPETNPNPALFPINPFVMVIALIFGFAAYWFLFELVTQRNIG